MHNTQQCGSFLESCFWVYKRIRRVAWLCMKTKRSGWGLVGTRLHVWLHSTDTDVVWQLPPPSRHQEAGRKIYKLGWGGAWGQTQDGQGQSTMISRLRTSNRPLTQVVSGCLYLKLYWDHTDEYTPNACESLRNLNNTTRLHVFQNGMSL